MCFNRMIQSTTRSERAAQNSRPTGTAEHIQSPLHSPAITMIMITCNLSISDKVLTWLDNSIFY